MRNRSAILAALIGAGAMAGCSTNNSVGNPQFTTHAKLRLAVGTLNDSFGTLTSVAGTYLNAVSTFRNQYGTSAYANPGTPSFALPGGASATTCGLFSYGQNPALMLAPFGNVNPGAPGPIGNEAPAFGKPPAFSPSDSNGIGYALGYLVYFNAGDPLNGPCTMFVLPPGPVAGSYTLSTTVAVNGNNISYSSSATLGSAPLVLPLEATPTYTPGAPGSGGGTFAFARPAGVTESVITIEDANLNIVASIESAGTSAVVPAGTLAPGSYTAFVMGADYPLVESSPTGSTAQAPAIIGAGGTADLTVSSVLTFPQP